jgi:hypothetical protein
MKKQERKRLTEELRRISARLKTLKRRIEVDVNPVPEWLDRAVMHIDGAIVDLEERQ